MSKVGGVRGDVRSKASDNRQDLAVLTVTPSKEPSPGPESARRSSGAGQRGSDLKSTGAMPKSDVKALLDSIREPLLLKAAEMALSGNAVAMRLCFERALPLLQDRRIVFDLPPIKSSADLPAATAALLRAVTRGEITSGEAEALRKMIDTHISALKLADLAERVTNLEEERRQ